MKRFITIALFLSIIVPSVYGNSGCQDHNDKKWEELQAAKVAYFTTSMDLSKEEAQVFWPLYNKYIDEIHEARKNVGTCFRAIAELTKKENTSEIDYKKAVNAYVDAYQKETEIDKLYVSEFYKILPAEKVAKMYVAEETFRHKMIRTWKKSHNPETKSKQNPEND